MSIVTVVIAALLPYPFGAISLVIIASQAALVSSPARVTAWTLCQIAAILCFVCRTPWLDHLTEMIALLGFQSFTAVAVYAAHREIDACRARGSANAEARATRSLLDSSTRADERTRIARELHDVLGHDLTALGLQLEIATHVAPDAVPLHLAKARAVHARLLRNVRQLVSSTGIVGATDLREPLRRLVEDLPGLTVHLALPDVLTVEDPARANCVLRCVQEISTNTLRHARATNLWISIEQRSGVLSLDARDDGGGAPVIAVGQGLAGMRARLEELDGTLQISSSPSFAVLARLPSGGKS